MKCQPIEEIKGLDDQDWSIPEGWKIEYNPKPINDRRFDYDFCHDDYDGDYRDGEWTDNGLGGNAASYEDAIAQIKEIEEDL